jgi:hypothetical protein
VAVLLNRLIKPEDVVCPAGQATGDANVRCGIEGHTLEGRLEPNSIDGFCCGEYTACLSWQAAKKVEEKGGDLPKILASMQDENRERRTRTQLRDARLRAAQRLLADPGPDGQKFRKRLGLKEFL